MQIITGKKIKPLAIMAYSFHGLGKTQFGSEFEKPIFIGNEENDEIDAARFPIVQTWKDFTDQLDYLLKNKTEYKTLVIDTIDALEQVAEMDILKPEKGKTMATAFGGYGKAYEKMHQMFLEIREKYLKPIRDKIGMNIVILSHAEKDKSYEDPITMISYNSYMTSMHKKVKPIFEDWVSAVLFITYKNFKIEGSDGKERAIGDGQRIILTEQRPSHVAKNRFDLPYELEYVKDQTVKELLVMIKNYYGKSDSYKHKEVEKVNETEKEINDILKRIKDESIVDKIKLSIARAGGDESELERIKSKAEKLAK